MRLIVAILSLLICACADNSGNSGSSTPADGPAQLEEDSQVDVSRGGGSSVEKHASLPYIAQLKEERPLLQGHVSGILQVKENCLVLRSNGVDLLPVFYPSVSLNLDGFDLILKDGDQVIPLNAPVRFVGGTLPESTDPTDLSGLPPRPCPTEMALIGDMT